ncbi:MAG: response regulator, partial [Planctomycetota bacterium]|nr:response regulator [Planctomycetota bacterium]
RPLRLLLAEDNAVNQKLAVRLLERRGHQVVVVDDGQQALDALEAARTSLNAFDLVLMDVQMPNLGGLEAAAIIRRREQAEAGGRRTPIIAMTARAMKGDREECLKSGFDGYISKPLRPQKLFDLIDELRPRDDELADGRRAPVFDRAALEDLTAGDFDLLREIVQLFLDDCPRMLAAIERDVRDGNLADLHQSAHEFKGSVANLAAPAAFDAARRLEEIARSGVFDRAAAERAWSDLARDVDALRDALRALLEPVDQPATT